MNPRNLSFLCHGRLAALNDHRSKRFYITPRRQLLDTIAAKRVDAWELNNSTERGRSGRNYTEPERGVHDDMLFFLNLEGGVFDRSFGCKTNGLTLTEAGSEKRSLLFFTFGRKREQTIHRQLMGIIEGRCARVPSGVVSLGLLGVRYQVLHVMQ